MHYFNTDFREQDTEVRANHGLPWTDKDEIKLQYFIGQGRSLPWLCDYFKRAAVSILCKGRNLGALELHNNKYCYPGSFNPATISKDVFMNTTFNTADTTTETPVIEIKTFIAGVDASTMSDAAIFRKIAGLESDIANLESIKARSTKIEATINQLQESIEALVAYVDGRP